MTSSQDWPVDAPDYSSLAAAVQGEAARWNVPGLTAATLHGGERTATATGVTNLNHPVPVTVDTRFQVGSITKVFTATAIMALVDRGELDLDGPITTWLPDVPLQRKAGLTTLTLRHLLNHTTGFEGDLFFDTGSGDDALAKGIDRYDRIPQWTVPGEVFAYCNTGFYLAGRIIEVVKDTTYEAAVSDLVLDPAGLEQTVFPSADLVTWPTASGHTIKNRKDGHAVYRPWALPRVVNAAGGIVSTVNDLLTFAEMHMDDGATEQAPVLSGDAARRMRERTSTSGVLDAGYGVGWNIRRIDGVTIAGHGGATNGFRAMLLTVPERRFALAMLSNGEPGSNAMEQIQAWALRRYLDLEADKRALLDVDDEIFDAVTGRYTRHDAVIDVWRVDDRVHIERTVVEHEDQFSALRRGDDPPTVIRASPTGEGVFRVMAGPFRDSLLEFFDGNVFADDSDDLVTRRLMRIGGRLAERVGDAPSTGPTITD